MFNNRDIFNDIDADMNHINSLFPDLRDSNSSLYYNYSEFNDVCTISDRNLSVVHINIRSLYPKIEEVKAELSLLDFQFDVLCFTESWLTDHIKNLVSFDNYREYHNLRVNRRGGGISVFVADRFEAELQSDYSRMTDHIEALFLELRSDNYRILVGTIYRPPSGDINVFLDDLQSILTTIDSKRYKEITLTGDFNLNLLKYDDDPIVRMFLNVLYSFSLFPVISKPTRITDTSASLLDNIFVKTPINYTAGSLISDLSDHFPVFCVFNNLFDRKISSSQISFSHRKINVASLTSLYNALNSYDFSDIVSCSDVNIAIARLDNVLFENFNIFCPLVNKTVSPKNVNKPWISRDIISHIKRRQNLSVLYRANIVTKVAFNRYRNFVSSKIRLAKTKYFENKFNEFKSDAKKTWKLINSLVKPSSNSKKSIIDQIVSNGTMIYNKYDIASSFNSFFVNIGSDIANSINSHNNDHKVYLQGDYPHSFFFSPVTSVEIDNIIRALKNKPSHFNCIPAIVLKFISRIVSPIIMCIVNRSIENGIFPDSLKIAKVVPIFKHGNKYVISNYRPISLLPLLSKIFEKIAHRQLVNYLDSKNVIFDHQYGFRANKSTDNAIIDLMQYIYEGLDNDFYVFSIFLDFKKAFDSVDHDVLLSKLYHYGVRGVAHDWFHSYLSNRKQYVTIDDSSSELQPITHGVPQGSILGPLLFLIFINDLPFCAPFFKFILFADDSTLSCRIPKNEVNNFHVLINVHLESVYRWLSANKIAINTEKTKYIVFSYRGSIQLSPVYIGDGQIENTNVTKFLGVNIDENLNFQSHVNFVSNKICKSVGIIFRLNYLPTNILLTLYQSLILPYLSYGILAYSGCSLSYFNKLFIAQKRCVRAIYKLEYLQRSY